MSDYGAYIQRLADVTRDSSFALWSALLTLNGIIASAFSVVAIFDAELKRVASFIVLSSIVSAWLLILNYRSTRDHFRMIGQISSTAIMQMTKAQKEKQLADSVKKHENCDTRERIAFILLIAQAAAIPLLLYFKQ